MFKFISIFALLAVIIKYGNSSAIREHPQNGILELYEEVNRDTIFNERNHYTGNEQSNIRARESQLERVQVGRRRIRRDERFESDEVVTRRSDNEYQAFLGSDFILPDNWRSLYSSSGLKRLSPCSS